MATTTNFGWETPDDTDLVKDGAAAIRTALGGVDTSFVDLKGGTTGQVLAKASATDLDFSWVAQDDSNAIQNTIVDAKGDLIAATADDTPARLAVGTNGQVLTADSTAATGLKWATSASGGTWTTYTPTYYNMTIGNGTVTAKYTQSGKLITVAWSLVLGSTTSFTGAVAISLPANCPSYWDQMVFPTGYIEDVGSTLFLGGVYFVQPDRFRLQFFPANASNVISDNVTGTAPMTWTTGDKVGITFTYEAA